MANERVSGDYEWISGDINMARGAVTSRTESWVIGLHMIAA